MGLTAIISSSASSSSATSLSSAATSLTSPVGMGVGGVFVAALLVGLLAYLDVFDASAVANSRVRTMLVAIIAPLAMTFGAIVVFKSLQVV